MGKRLKRYQHDSRDNRNGQYRKSNPCDACGRSVGTAYYTDEEVCGNTDGPGFFLCDRVRCEKKRDLPDVEARRALYTAQRALNDAADRDAADRPALRSDTAPTDDIPDSGCAECGKRFWSADGHPTLALCRECWQPDAGIRCLEERIAKAAAVIAGYGMTDGAHHKQWCLDQVLRAMLTNEQYATLVARMNAHPDCASWDVGIAP